MPHHGPLRLFRSLVFTGAIVGLAAGGHLLGGGILPAPMITLALTALLLVPVTWMSKRELSFPALLGLLGVGQAVLHEALSTLSVSAVCQTRVTQAPAWGRGSHHAATSSLHCLPANPMELSAHTAAGIEPVTMLAGHALAVLATAWLLRRGEAALWQLLAWLRPLAVLPRPAVIPVAGARTFAHDPLLIPVPWRNLRRHSLRGPPFAAFLPTASC